MITEFLRDPDTTIEVGTNVSTNQSQDISVDTGDATSASGASITTTSISNYRTRTPPITTFPPYLPYWTHGGWGTIKAYFPNGPNSDDQVYERVFNPGNPIDMRELRGVLESLPYESPLGVFGGFLNGVGAIFGGPDNYHHGRGFEIANSLVRTRRPRGKPLLVFIDSNIDTNLLRNAGYAYVGKVSLEGKVDRNWDHVYDAAVAEALPWNVDILLVSGGMKGVTVGSNFSFPGAGGAYSQTNYSVSMFGAVSSGITEGKGKALVSAAGYRYWPAAAKRRRIPQAFYDRIHAKVHPVRKSTEAVQQVLPATKKEEYPVAKKEEHPVAKKEEYPVAKKELHHVAQKEKYPAAAKEKRPAIHKKKRPGVRVSQELLEMAGFAERQQVDHLAIK
ncbi:MAG: hypothetical protein IIC00_15500 [Planctomycetes bacterium]|nr:hypothetical protein [Planctomycetota bacterium]